MNQHGKAALALRDLGSLNVRFLNVQEFPIVALINPHLAVGHCLDRLSASFTFIVRHIRDQRAIFPERSQLEILKTITLELELVDHGQLRCLAAIQKDNRGVAGRSMSNSGFHDFWNHRRGRGVATALRAHDAVDNHHSDTRQISALDAFQHSFSERMLRFVDQHESSGAAGLD